MEQAVDEAQFNISRRMVKAKKPNTHVPSPTPFKNFTEWADLD